MSLEQKTAVEDYVTQSRSGEGGGVRRWGGGGGRGSWGGGGGGKSLQTELNRNLLQSSRVVGIGEGAQFVSTETTAWDETYTMVINYKYVSYQ